MTPEIVDTISPEFPTSPVSQLNGLPDHEDDPLFWPFQTLGDFEQTEFFIKNNLSDRQINEQLQLLVDYTKPHHPGGGITLSSARKMHQVLHQASEDFDQPEVRTKDLELHICW